MVEKPNKYVFQPNLRQDFESTRNVSGKHVNHLPLQGRIKLHIPTSGKRANHHRLKSALEQGCRQTLESPIFRSENSVLVPSVAAYVSANEFYKGTKLFNVAIPPHNHGFSGKMALSPNGNPYLFQISSHDWRNDK